MPTRNYFFIFIFWVLQEKTLLISIMVKTRNGHNKKEEDKDVYNAALILYSMSRSKKVLGLLEPTCRFHGLIESPKKHVDVDNVVQRSSASTSTISVNEAPPDQDPPNDDNEVALAAGGGGDPVAPPVPMIVNVIGACSPPLVKQLTKSDVTDGQGRLTLRKEFVNLNLVPMFNADEDLIVGIDVTAFDVEGRRYDMTFKLWASKLYVLMKGWKEFYKRNNLREAVYVSVWMFRHVDTQKLCFAITQGRAGGP